MMLRPLGSGQIFEDLFDAYYVSRAKKSPRRTITRMK